MDVIRRRRQSGYPCYWLKPIIRFWGIITAIVCCGVGADLTANKHKYGASVLTLSLLVFFLEIKWIITLFVQLLFPSDSSSNCYECWSACRFFGGWRLSPVYLAFGTALILWPQNLWLSNMAGFQLILLALLRLLTLIRFTSSVKDEGLLPSSNNFQRADGFTSIVDVDEDDLNEVRTSLEDEEAIDGDEELLNS
ncbi:hypothetical protein ACFFRR_010851 [Megaselia abdita]